MASKEPKHVGTWVLAISPQYDLNKWGLEGDTVFPYPPDDVEALAQAKYLAESNTHKDDSLFILHVFDNGQMKQFDYDPDEMEVVDKEKPLEFPKDAPYNLYDVEGLEKFVVRTNYKSVVARSDEEAVQLVKAGEYSYDSHTIEEGDDEWLRSDSVEMVEQDVNPADYADE